MHAAGLPWPGLQRPLQRCAERFDMKTGRRNTRRGWPVPRRRSRLRRSPTTAACSSPVRTGRFSSSPPARIQSHRHEPDVHARAGDSRALRRPSADPDAGSDHGCRKEVAGSTRSARRAGPAIALIAAQAIKPAAETSDAMSRGATPKTRPLRPAAVFHAVTLPAPTPAAIGASPRDTASQRSAVAPRRARL